jgi:hypothetical protein
MQRARQQVTLEEILDSPYAKAYVLVCPINLDECLSLLHDISEARESGNEFAHTQALISWCAYQRAHPEVEELRKSFHQARQQTGTDIE